MRSGRHEQIGGIYKFVILIHLFKLFLAGIAAFFDTIEEAPALLNQEGVARLRAVLLLLNAVLLLHKLRSLLLVSLLHFLRICVHEGSHGCDTGLQILVFLAELFKLTIALGFLLQGLFATVGGVGA